MPDAEAKLSLAPSSRLWSCDLPPSPRNPTRAFPITVHPDVSGRPHVLMMLERLYHYMIGHPGVRFVTMNEMADDFARRSPRAR